MTTSQQIKRTVIIDEGHLVIAHQPMRLVGQLSSRVVNGIRAINAYSLVPCQYTSS